MDNTQRDVDICSRYLEGRPIVAIGEQFGLKRQRVLQILKKAGVWRPREKTVRTQFLGVSINEKTKVALKVRAKREGVSVSQLASDHLDTLVKP